MDYDFAGSLYRLDPLLVACIVEEIYFSPKKSKSPTSRTKEDVLDAVKIRYLTQRHTIDMLKNTILAAHGLIETRKSK